MNIFIKYAIGISSIIGIFIMPLVADADSIITLINSGDQFQCNITTGGDDTCQAFPHGATNTNQLIQNVNHAPSGISSVSFSGGTYTDNSEYDIYTCNYNTQCSNGGS